MKHGTASLLGYLSKAPITVLPLPVRVCVYPMSVGNAISMIFKRESMLALDGQHGSRTPTCPGPGRGFGVIVSFYSYTLESVA